MSCCLERTFKVSEKTRSGVEEYGQLRYVLLGRQHLLGFPKHIPCFSSPFSTIYRRSNGTRKTDRLLYICEQCIQGISLLLCPALSRGYRLYG